MNQLINKIYTIDKAICRNIEQLSSIDRGLLSQNILAQLRNFVEHINLFIYSKGKDILDTYENLKRGNQYVYTHAQFSFLRDFHKTLQISTSHYTLDNENSERLMLKYYEYLFKIKKFLKNYDIHLLSNLNLFPTNLDSTLSEYYKQISQEIEKIEKLPSEKEYENRYYIQKIVPFFVNENIFYEVTLTLANDYVSKFDRIIAFTNQEILENYAVKLNLCKGNITILDKKIPILLIKNWEISIRKCELNHFADLFGKHPEISPTREYILLMDFLKNNKLTLSDFLKSSSDYYNKIKVKIWEQSNSKNIFNMLDRARSIIENKEPGCNILSYLLYNFNNKIIKAQKASEPCCKLSYLYLNFGTKPFDDMPFNTSLIFHNPKISDLLQCIDAKSRTNEFLARFLRNNVEQNGIIYTSKAEIQQRNNEFANVDDLIQCYNSNLYYKHFTRKLKQFKNFVYIDEYEKNIVKIITLLIKFSKCYIKEYSASTKQWIEQNPSYVIDCDEKRQFLINMFSKSAVALIYGPAGTGKSTLIKHISERFSNCSKLYLAQTNPAIDNLKRKVVASQSDFMTIQKFLTRKDISQEYDILFIDECSTVSNCDMVQILSKAAFKLLVLVGDIYQIESIIFGNWFNIIKYFIPKESIFELTKPYRSQDPYLLKFWDHVRNLTPDIKELLITNNYSHSLDETIFHQEMEDEIILCLNYDGLYGINNINRFLQAINFSNEILWDGQTYKVNDPILFNETYRFGSCIYNNLKGKIVSIKKNEENIQFDIEINKILNSFDIRKTDLNLVKTLSNGHSIIRFSVNKYKNSDEDSSLSEKSIVPFQIAYAVSIHKAQGLEYDSVKIVITDEIDEMITHNVFYTAITRARKKLKIYWSPEIEEKILKKLQIKSNKRDVSILKQKFSDKFN